MSEFTETQAINDKLIELQTQLEGVRNLNELLSAALQESEASRNTSTEIYRLNLTEIQGLIAKFSTMLDSIGHLKLGFEEIAGNVDRSTNRIDNIDFPQRLETIDRAIQIQTSAVGAFKDNFAKDLENLKVRTDANFASSKTETAASFAQSRSETTSRFEVVQKALAQTESAVSEHFARQFKWNIAIFASVMLVGIVCAALILRR